MPILGSYAGARGFGRGGLLPFSASGGTFTVDANGYRHHIFNASGTLTASGAPQSALVLLVGGGEAGSPGALNLSDATGGSGGRGGYWIRWNSTISGNVSVLVGGSGSNSSVSGGVSLNSSNVGGVNSTDSTFNGGRVFDYFNGTFFSQDASTGSNGPAIRTAGGTAFGPYLNLANIPSNLGGSGGGGGAHYVPQNVTASPSSGGLSGGGAGGSGVTPSSGSNGAANTGGGGGGGGVRATSYPGGESRMTGSVRDPGLGGSGYVIISYLLQ